jgi:hypothetical protein
MREARIDSALRVASHALLRQGKHIRPVRELIEYMLSGPSLSWQTA